MSSLRILFLFVGLLACLYLPTVGQGTGSRDTGFGLKGEVRFDFAPDETCARLLTDAMGNFYFVGNTTRYDSVADLDFLIGKCTSEGKLDSTFGANGILTGDFGTFGNSRILDADLQGNTIYVIGEANDLASVDTQQVFIGKLDLDGHWDAGFGNDGIFTRKFVGEWASAGAIRVLDDGRIAFCGMTTDTNAWHIELPMAGRLLPNGVPDSSFGNTGCITWSLAHGLSHARGPHSDGGRFETLLPVGKGMLLGGVFYTSSYGRAMFMMVDENGNLDDGFGENGLLFPDISPGFTCTVTHSVKRGPKIFLGAKLDVYQGGEDFALLTLDSTGSFLDYDPVDFDSNEDRLQDMLIDHNDRILICGLSKSPDNQSPGYESDAFAVAALEDSRTLASEFAENGKSMTIIQNGMESGATAMCESPAGKLVVAGYTASSGPGNYTDLVIIRLLLDSMSQSPSLPNAGFAVFPNPVHDRLWLNADAAETCSIWDSQGKLVLGNVASEAGIDVSMLTRGVYLIEANGFCRRFLKK